MSNLGTPTGAQVKPAHTDHLYQELEKPRGKCLNLCLLLGGIGVQHLWPLLATEVASCLQPAPRTLINNTGIRKPDLTKTWGRHSNTRWLSQKLVPRNARDAVGEFYIAPCSKYASIRNRVLETSPGKMKFVSLQKSHWKLQEQNQNKHSQGTAPNNWTYKSISRADFLSCESKLDRS